MIKINGEWQKSSWEKAIEYAARGLWEIRENWGADATAVYQGNPSVHNLGTSLYSPLFVRSLNTKNRYSATSVDQLAHHLAGEYMFGHMFLIPVPDIDRTDFWLILGGNPLVSNGSLMTAPNVAGKLKAIQSRGGKVVVVDPRRTKTAAKADKHLFVRPGTDIWLLLAIIHEIFRQDKVTLGALKPYIDQAQLEIIRKNTAPFSPAKAAQITGIARLEIIKLTKELVSASSAVVYGRLGVSATKYGGLCHWAINVLNIITGNFDRPGGAMLTDPLIDLSKSRGKNKRFSRWKSRVRGLPEFGGELPAVTLAEDIIEPGEGQIKALITSCGNPVLSVPNGKKLDRALEALEFMVSIDIYLNETTRHADVILPPATGLETPHYGLAFHNLAVRNTAKYSEASVEKEPGSKYDWEIFSELKRSYENFQQTPDLESPTLTLDQTLGLLLSGNDKINFEELKNLPHGIDFGPLTPVIPDRLKTEDAMIDLMPSIYLTCFKDLLNENINDDSLLLIGRRNLRSNNSWLHNCYRMVKGPNQCTMLINPKDAQIRKISDGEIVQIRSRVGSEKIKAEISDDIMAGCVSIPHGWGHHRTGIKLSVAQEFPGISLNDLLDDKEVDPLSGVSVINGIRVEVININKTVPVE